jgi:hypothetical protein
MADIQMCVIEYDSNGCVFLVDVDGHAAPIPLEHGGLIAVESYTPPRYAASTVSAGRATT